MLIAGSQPAAPGRRQLRLAQLVIDRTLRPFVFVDEHVAGTAAAASERLAEPIDEWAAGRVEHLDADPDARTVAQNSVLVDGVFVVQFITSRSRHVGSPSKWNASIEQIAAQHLGDVRSLAILVFVVVAVDPSQVDVAPLVNDLVDWMKRERGKLSR
ncbi:MAG: hypothetical protein WAK69_04410, partial [Rhodoplanes sp.]